MARIRTIKPEFWTSAQVLECSPNARLLFIAMWNFSDDAGRHIDNPKQIKAEAYPGDEFTLDDIRGMLDELAENSLIRRYVVDGKGYFCITGWHNQRIDKPQKPRYPGPVGEDSANIPGTLPPDRKGRERKGKEGIGEDGNGTRPRVYPPDDFCPTVAIQQKITAENRHIPNVVDRLVEQFKTVEFLEPQDWQKRFLGYALEQAPKLATTPKASPQSRSHQTDEALRGFLNDG